MAEMNAFHQALGLQIIMKLNSNFVIFLRQTSIELNCDRVGR